MADSILSSLLSRASLTLVNNNTGKDVAEKLKVVGVNFHYRARPMRHMREDGTSIVDSKVIDPVLVEIDVICPSLDAINQVNQTLMDRKDTYTFTSKGIQLQDAVCERFELRQSAEMISASPVRITLKQLRRQGGPSGGRIVEQPADSSMFGRGIQSVSTVTASIQASFIGVFNG